MSKPTHVFKDKRGKIVTITPHEVFKDSYDVEGSFGLTDVAYQKEQVLVKEILRLKKIALGKKS